MIFRMLMSNIVLVLLLNVLTDFYFYRYFIRKFTDSKFMRVSHWAIDALLVLTMVFIYIIMALGSSISYTIFHYFMLIYLLLYIPKFVYMVFSLPALVIKRRRMNLIFYGLGALWGTILLLMFIYGATIGPGSLRVTETNLAFDDLPESFNGYTIVHFSDAHLGNMKSDRLLKKALAEIDEIDPDIIIFSGDLVHSRAEEAEEYTDVLSRFKARDGVYTVLGNHDYGWRRGDNRIKEELKLGEIYKDTGWVLLNNESVAVKRGNDSIALIGVENWGLPPYPQHGNLKAAIEPVEDMDFKMLISHNPVHWAEQVIKDTDVDLTFSGHTHGMQLAVNLFSKRYSPASLRYKLWGGLYNEGDQYLYINEGLGVVMLPFRFGALPELSIIRLEKKNEKI